MRNDGLMMKHLNLSPHIAVKRGKEPAKRGGQMAGISPLPKEARVAIARDEMDL